MAEVIVKDVNMAVDIAGGVGNEIVYDVPLQVDIRGGPGEELLYDVALTVDITKPAPPPPPPPEEKELWDKIVAWLTEYWYVVAIAVVAFVIVVYLGTKYRKGGK